MSFVLFAGSRIFVVLCIVQKAWKYHRMSSVHVFSFSLDGTTLFFFNSADSRLEFQMIRAADVSLRHYNNKKGKSADHIKLLGVL